MDAAGEGPGVREPSVLPMAVLDVSLLRLGPCMEALLVEMSRTSPALSDLSLRLPAQRFEESFAAPEAPSFGDGPPKRAQPVNLLRSCSLENTDDGDGAGGVEVASTEPAACHNPREDVAGVEGAEAVGPWSCSAKGVVGWCRRACTGSGRSSTSASNSAKGSSHEAAEDTEDAPGEAGGRTSGPGVAVVEAGGRTEEEQGDSSCTAFSAS
mmetsp:Transcript_92087/g.263889  ORF Transcript_92087/g.263889 Transcript_92087/m.263889 type:complete len:211 (+) Transcript_92087:142-774(+)